MWTLQSLISIPERSLNPPAPKADPYKKIEPTAETVGPIPLAWCNQILKPSTYLVYRLFRFLSTGQNHSPGAIRIYGQTPGASVSLSVETHRFFHSPSAGLLFLFYHRGILYGKENRKIQISRHVGVTMK